MLPSSSWAGSKTSVICIDYKRRPTIAFLTRSGIRRQGQPCVYYPNTVATFHVPLEGDLVFKLNPGPRDHVLRSTGLAQKPLKPRVSRSYRNTGNLVSVPCVPQNSYGRLHTPMTLSLVNVRSVRPKSADPLELVCDMKSDVICLTETWLTPDEVAARNQATLSGYALLNQPRISRKGGGLAIFYADNLSVNRVRGGEERSFEYLESVIKYEKFRARVVNIYRPPYSETHPVSVNTFITEFSHFLESIILSAEPLVIVGDFNIHVDDANDPEAAIFLDLLESMNLKRLVTRPTHERGHTLDLIITRETDSVVHGIPLIGRFFSDHAVITCRLNSIKPPVPMKTVTYRKLKAVNIGELRRDLINSRLADRTSVDLDELVHAYDDTLASLTERHAPLRTRTFTNRPRMPWFNDDIKATIRERRRAERQWKRSGAHQYFVAYKRAKNYASLVLNQARSCYLSDFIMDNSDSKAKLFRAIKSLLSQPRSFTVPPYYLYYLF